MKKFCVLFVGIVILAIAGISAYGTEEKPVESELGSYYEEGVDQENSETDVVMAVYKEKTVMKSVVEYQRKAQEALAGKPEGTGSSDREIVDDILKNVILQEEAEQRGLMPTEEEVEQYLQETVYAAYAMPEGKEGIDAYCASAGITYEEYVENLRDQAPRVLAKGKLKEAIAEEYCQSHGLTYDRLNTPQEALDAVEEYMSNLLELHKEEITYYRDYLLYFISVRRTQGEKIFSMGCHKVWVPFVLENRKVRSTRREAPQRKRLFC